MDDYLSKPVQLTHLKAVLQKWLPARCPLHPAQPLARLLAPATSSTAEKPVEVSVLEGLVGNDPDVISEFLRDFRTSRPG